MEKIDQTIAEFLNSHDFILHSTIPIHPVEKHAPKLQVLQ
jgi:hypothetical protein